MIFGNNRQGRLIWKVSINNQWLRVEESEDAGRFLVASRDIEKGEVIIITIIICNHRHHRCYCIQRRERCSTIPMITMIIMITVVIINVVITSTLITMIFINMTMITGIPLVAKTSSSSSSFLSSTWSWWQVVLSDLPLVAGPIYTRTRPVCLECLRWLQLWHIWWWQWWWWGCQSWWWLWWRWWWRWW